MMYILLALKCFLKDPKEAVDITITPGQGKFRDGLLDRYGQRLDQEDTYIYQFSTRSGAFLDILSPPNEAVGEYVLELTAKDTAGLSSLTRLPIEIKNINDEPYINRNNENKIRALFGSINSEDTALEEGDKFVIPYTKLFSDDDYLLGDIVNEKLDIKLETKDGNKLEYIDVNSTASGDIQLVYEPPRGILSYIKNEFKFVASDQKEKALVQIGILHTLNQLRN